MMEIVVERSLEAIERLEPKTAWGSARPGTTCWWTISDRHLYLREGTRIVQKHSPLGQQMCLGVHSDPRGFDVHEVDFAYWIRRARQLAEAGKFGAHGMRAFMAAFHGCAVLQLDRRDAPWSSDRWHDYSAALDRRDARSPSAA
jgi:hypothetical protein